MVDCLRHSYLEVQILITDLLVSNYVTNQRIPTYVQFYIFRDNYNSLSLDILLGQINIIHLSDNNGGII